MNVKTVYLNISLLLLLLVLSRSSLTAQRNDCNANIDWAKALYDQGKIEDVPDMLGNCPIQKTLPKAKRLEALVLVTETYLYLKETEKADSTFLLLLKLNPAFELDSFSLSVELDRLGKTFRTKPIFNIGLNVGSNITFIRSMQSFSPDYTTNAFAAPTTSFLPSYRLGLDFDYPLGHFIELSTGIDLVRRGYRYEDKLINARMKEEFEDYGQLSFKESQQWIDLPFAIRIVFPQFKIRPYLYLGTHTNILINSKLTSVQRNFQETSRRAELLEIFSLKNKEEGLRTATNFSLTGGLGMKIPLGLDYLIVDLQYNYQLNNAVNRQNRYSNSQLLYEFLYVDDDFLQSDLSITIGFSKSIYKPRKKRKSPFLYTTTMKRKQPKSKTNSSTEPIEEIITESEEEEVQPIIDDESPKSNKNKSAKSDRKSKIIKSQKPKKDN